MRKQITPQYSGQQTRRHGMALLFVVSLILFITLLGTSFVVVSQQFAKSSKIRTRIDARGDSSRQLVERAVFDLLRGPALTNLGSPMRGQSLLADMWGYGITGQVETAVASTQITGAVEITLFDADLGTAEYEIGLSMIPGAGFASPSEAANAYNGQVLTFTSGNNKDETVRIIGYSGLENGNATGLPYTFTVYPGISNPVNLANSNVILNGKAFTGWGAGGLAVGGGLTNQAYLPRRMNDGSAAVISNVALSPYIDTGVNESYDAFGFQNPFLSINQTAGRVSFNDPELFAYVRGISADDEEKYANFRPMTNLYLQNVEAAGGDPNAVPVTRANGWANPTESLEVDNDGDGVVDSIWIDMGYPVQTDINGRRYKPLVALMVRDMDGRLSVNAHGNGFQLDRAVAGPVRSTVEQQLLLGEIDGAPTATQQLPRGSSMGPAEIDLGYLISDDVQYGLLIADRYGEDGLPGIARLNSASPNDEFRDPWNYFSTFGYPDFNAGTFDPGETYINENVGGLFNTALDMHGRYVTGILNNYVDVDGNGTFDAPIGHPNRSAVTQLVHPSQEIASSQYELSLSEFARHPWQVDGTTGNSDDTPFSPKEMERILRRYDRDSGSLPSRLADILPAGVHDTARNILTSESWEVPAVPGFVADLTYIDPDTTNPFEALATDPTMPQTTPVAISDRLFHILVHNGMTKALANTTMQEILPHEVRMGLPMDINRPFGDGKDNNGNGVVDEHAESTDPLVNESIDVEYINAMDTYGITPSTQLNFDPNIDGDNNVATRDLNFLARQQFAMQLYVMALLATDDTDAPNLLAGVVTPDETRRTALAQWAINVADFRDPDSINTPFEVDLHPFDGWVVDGFVGVGPGPDGILGNGDDADDSITAGIQRKLVWGAERPELLISETMATHDRRTQDLTSAGGGDTSSGDNDFDSRLVPRAAAFFELYHPWSQDNNNQLLPEELTGGNAGINLRQTNAVGDPVWRMVTINGNSASVNQNPLDGNIDEADVTRRIYFVEPDITSTDTDSTGTGSAFAGEKVYFPSAAGALVVTRGGYAVVGSSGVGTEAAFGETFFGRRSTAGWATEFNQTRGINLDEGARTVETFDPVTSTTETRTDVAVAVIDRNYDSGTSSAIDRSLGLSDPVGGYGAGLIEEEDGFALAGAVDLPLDYDAGVQNDPRVLFDGTIESFAEVHLQRLANPLMEYDPVLNPYLSIDTKTIDLLAFNGVEDDSAETVVNSVDKLFASGERGRIADPLYDGPLAGVNQRRCLWVHEESGTPIGSVSAKPEFTTLGGADNHVFSFEMHDSFGQLNEAYTDLAPRTPTNLTTGTVAPIGFSGLPWLNRPFANSKELMDVTWTGSHQMLFMYTVPDYSTVTPFQHLLNFEAFVPNDYPNTTLTPENPNALPLGMAKLFDFVRVPSRYTGNSVYLTDSIAPPFHTLPLYREPGKVNLNTIGNPTGLASGVWQGVLGPMYGAAGTADGLFNDGAATTYTAGQVSGATFWNSMTSGATGPAEFDNPFRNGIEFDMVPPGLNDHTTGTETRPHDVTMFRTEGGGANPPGVFQANGNLPYAHPSRDSKAANGVLQRLGDNVTTRSSVFSIWVTVGKFEVDENGVLVGTADGLVELGADRGNVERSRGFYMIDRSIPVGFEPGKNHNIEKMILIESIID